MKDWKDRVAEAVAVLATVLLLWFCLGCGSTVEVCYEHEKYGKVCVKLDGSKVVSARTEDGKELSDAEKVEVEKKLSGGSTR